MIVKIQRNRCVGNRKCNAVQERMRKTRFPVTREYTRLLFKQNIECSMCLVVVDLPKTENALRLWSVPSDFGVSHHCTLAHLSYNNKGNLIRLQQFINKKEKNTSIMQFYNIASTFTNNIFSSVRQIVQSTYG